MGRAFAGDAAVCRTVLQTLQTSGLCAVNQVVRRKALWHKALRVMPAYRAIGAGRHASVYGFRLLAYSPRRRVTG